MTNEKCIWSVPTASSEKKEPQVAVPQTPPPTSGGNNYVSVVIDFRPLVEAVLLLVIVMAVIQLLALSSRA